MKTLTKEFGGLQVTVDALGNGVIDSAASAEGWIQQGPIGPDSRVFSNHKYIDLGGMSIDDKTMFFQGATVQDVVLPSVSPSTAGALVQVIDIMTNKPLATDIGFNLVLNGNLAAATNVDLTFDQTIYMRSRTFNMDIDNQASGYLITIADNQLGSLSPTASDRVYCTRYVIFGATQGTYIASGCRYVLRAEAREEAEYQYLMRLKRSYELQQTFDRD